MRRTRRALRIWINEDSGIVPGSRDQVGRCSVERNCVKSWRLETVGSSTPMPVMKTSSGCAGGADEADDAGPRTMQVLAPPKPREVLSVALIFVRAGVVERLRCSNS